MRRRHAISPVFPGHYQDLGIAGLTRHDSANACKLILSVGVCGVLHGAAHAARGEHGRGARRALLLRVPRQTPATPETREEGQHAGRRRQAGVGKPATLISAPRHEMTAF